MYAIAVPILRNKVDAWKAWMRECTGSRIDEFEAFNERMGLTLHQAWLTEGREGPLVIVVYDGSGAETFIEKLERSKEPFDKWFRERVSEYHGMDFSKLVSMPKSVQYCNWQAPHYAGAQR